MQRAKGQEFGYQSWTACQPHQTKSHDELIVKRLNRQVVGNCRRLSEGMGCGVDGSGGIVHVSSALGVPTAKPELQMWLETMPISYINQRALSFCITV